MKDKITIGELAKLVGTSTYNIRYYEKEGLISTPEIGENGYRLYGYKEFYELSTIMLFRDVNFSIKKIKELQSDFELEKYKNALNETYDELTHEINRLMKLKDKIKYKKEILLKYEDKLEKFEVKELKKKSVYHLLATDYNKHPTLG
ncbi:MerR family transcriptional regulator, partial [Clostridiaceae bacterium HSG29]|nr:MerR family transcriptional regulator [Clostridiaceae bacterium HSG29]